MATLAAMNAGRANSYVRKSARFGCDGQYLKIKLLVTNAVEAEVVIDVYVFAALAHHVVIC